MYIYHARINTLSAHMIHINLNMIFCTHVEHSSTKIIYIKYYKKEKKKKNTRQKQIQFQTLNITLILAGGSLLFCFV